MKTKKSPKQQLNTLKQKLKKSVLSDLDGIFELGDWLWEDFKQHRTYHNEDRYEFNFRSTPKLRGVPKKLQGKCQHIKFRK